MLISRGEIPRFMLSRNCVVGIAIGYGLVDWGGRSSSPDRVKNFLFFTSSRPALGSPMGNGGKAAGVWSWPLSSIWCRGHENMDLYIHSPIRLYVVVLNLLKHSGYYMHMLEHCILPTQCVCVLHMVLTINSDCFQKRHEPVGLRSGDITCFLWGTNWMFILS
jgi:hypothetical protein